jgi:hypothetical protein
VSWDLYLVPPEAARDPGAWLEEAAGREVDAEAARRHADVVLARRQLELFGPSEYGYELSEPDGSPFPLEVGLHGDHASVSVAYWDLGDREAELGDIVVEIVSALRDETGWIAFDPQSDRVVDLDELRREFASGHAHGVDRVADVAASESKPKRRRRFFGIF